LNGISKDEEHNFNFLAEMLKKLKFMSKILNHSFGSINLILTRRCNLQCPHCEVIKRNNGKELSVDDWKVIIDRLSKKYFIFVFTGGEPLLYNGLEELISYASHKGITGLLTNGILLTEEKIKSFKTLDYINISYPVFYSNLETKFLDTVKILIHYSKIFKFIVSSTVVVHAKNVLKVPEIVKKLNDLKVNIEISLLHSSDDKLFWYRCNRSDLAFKEAELNDLENLEKELIKMKKCGYRILTPLGYISRMADYVRKKVFMQCFAVERFFTVNNDGFIMPCQDIPPSNINALDFKDFNQLKEIRKNIPENCNCWWDCAYFYSLFSRGTIKQTVSEIAILAHSFFVRKLKINIL